MCLEYLWLPVSPNLDEIFFYRERNSRSLEDDKPSFSRMRSFLFAGVLLFESLLQPSVFALSEAASNIRSIYLFKDVMKSNTTALKTSGFNTVVIFGVGILGNGDIMVRTVPFSGTMTSSVLSRRSSDG
jgi:hypothetical protein